MNLHSFCPRSRLVPRRTSSVILIVRCWHQILIFFPQKPARTIEVWVDGRDLGAKSHDLGPVLRSFPITSIVGPKPRGFPPNSDAVTPPVPVAAGAPRSGGAAGAPSLCSGAQRNPNRSPPGAAANAPKFASKKRGEIQEFPEFPENRQRLGRSPKSNAEPLPPGAPGNLGTLPGAE